jgi:hypothetical protein
VYALAPRVGPAGREGMGLKTGFCWGEPEA